MQTSDFLIVGGGIVGLATARALSLRFPDASICLLEKESDVAQHQSGRNSGVLHSGIYYKPGSIKAQTCRDGRSSMVDFCQQEGIDFEICGKVIVATQESEIAALERIYQRGQANGIECREIDRIELTEREPHCSGIAAIHVPSSGIVDYPAVCRRIAENLRVAGHAVEFSRQVSGIQRSGQTVAIECTDGSKYQTKFLVGCGGLHSDRIVRMSGLQPPAKIVPFRGEYYELKPDARSLCRHLIYPVPDPNFPFLGVHFTRMVSGDVECGPNAVFALAREGYSWGKISPGDIVDAVRFKGFRSLAWQHWKMGLGEIHRSISKRAFVKALQRLIPEVQSEHLRPCRAGVRAQAMTVTGEMVDDFLWVSDESMLHVCNAPSPAATASLEIGRHIVDQIESQISS